MIRSGILSFFLSKFIWNIDVNFDKNNTPLMFDETYIVPSIEPVNQNFIL